MFTRFIVGPCSLLLALLAANALATSASAQPTLGSGAVKSVFSAASTGGGGSASGGRFVWFDLTNTDGKLSWPTSRELDRLADQVASRERAASEIEQELSRRMRAGVLWRNVCLSAGGSTKTGSYTRKSDNATLVACVGSYSNASSFPHWHEFHTPTYQARSGDVGVIDRLVGWNIRIWREGESEPVFERRVGLTRSGSDTDTATLRDPSWWYGGVGGGPKRTADRAGRGGVWSNATRSAGPLGSRFSEDDAACRQRFSAAPKSINYREQAGSASYLNYAKHSLNGEKRSIDNACYWQWKSPDGVEAVWLSWRIPSANEAGWGFLNYKIQGLPGRFYAVLITPIDHREQLLLPLVETPREHIVKGNYFRVFIPVKSKLADPGPATPPDDDGPSETDDPDEPHGSDEPEVIIPEGPEDEDEWQLSDPPPADSEQLPHEVGGLDPASEPELVNSEPALLAVIAADTPVATRAETLAEIATVPDAPLADSQAIFPRSVYLLHYTPQTLFNGARGGYPYDPGAYARYDTDTGDSARVPYPFPGPEQSPFAWMVRLAQPALISDDTAILSENRFGITWLQTTLENPCSRWSRSPEAPWPTSQQSCSSEDGGLVRNAWDDALSAQVVYERRFTQQGSTMSRGLVRDQWLRCNGEVGAAARAVEGCEPTHRLQFYGAENYGLTAEQFTQGQFTLTWPNGSPPGAAALVWLETNRLDRLAGWRLWRRESGEEVALPSTIYAVDGERVPLLFCQPGAPSGSRLALGSDGSSGDRAVTSNEAGDALCAGPAVRWQWRTSSCAAGSRPGVQSFPAPTLPGSQNGYSAYPELAWSEGGVRTVPYLGDRPGDGIVRRCRDRSGRDGYLREGSWTIAQEAAEAFGLPRSGPRLEIGTYIVEFSYANLTPQELSSDAGVRWRLGATYEGYTGWRWRTQTTATAPFDERSTAFVSVYGFRTTR